MYIKAFFCKQYAVLILSKHLVEVLSRWEKVFWVSHFTPDCGANETVPPASYYIFLQYELNGLQLLTCVLFIQIVWFTIQYNFMHYARFFQEFHWVLTLSVSYWLMLRYNKVFLLPQWSKFSLSLAWLKHGMKTRPQVPVQRVKTFS